MASIKEKLTGFFTDEEFDDEYMDEQDPASRDKKINVSSNSKSKYDYDDMDDIKTSGLEEALRGKQSKVLVIEPMAYSEAQEIAEHLLQERAVIINLQKIAPEQGKRIIDFLSGTIYAVNGDLQKVSTNTYLCTPDTFGVAGKISDDIGRTVQ